MLSSTTFNTQDAFLTECAENHMRVQDEDDDVALRAFYGDEYMGYFHRTNKKGFLFLEPLSIPILTMLH